MKKRKDKNGRALQSGESICKDGRYMYRYVGIDGKHKTVLYDYFLTHFWHTFIAYFREFIRIYAENQFYWSFESHSTRGFDNSWKIS